MSVDDYNDSSSSSSNTNNEYYDVSLSDLYVGLGKRKQPIILRPEAEYWSNKE